MSEEEFEEEETFGEPAEAFNNSRFAISMISRLALLMVVKVEKLDLVDPFGLMFVLLLKLPPRLLRLKCC